MNRAARRAAARAKKVRARPLPRVHTMILGSEYMPKITHDRILTQKIALLEGIAALKNGTMTYGLMCNLHDFIAMALRFVAQFNDEALRQPAEECAAALTGIMERYVERGSYVATGDELRALQEWVEAIADYLAAVPAPILEGMAADMAAEELATRAKIAREIQRAAG